jgi:hypothetical protein
MKNLSQSDNPDAAAQARVARQKVPCSPRAAVAFSAWSSWTFILEVVKDLYQQIVGQQETTGAPKASDGNVCDLSSPVHLQRLRSNQLPDLRASKEETNAECR